MELSDGLLKTPQIRTILTRHERVAADMADGYARVSGQPGVCLAVLGPGAAHLFAGFAQSSADHVPVLGIVGQAPRARLGTRATSEMPLLPIFQHVTKWESTINMPTRVAEVMRRAFAQLRSGQPGAVLLEIPSDVALESFPDEQFDYRPVGEPRRWRPDAPSVERAAAVLASAQRPVIYAGSGILRARAGDALRSLAELLGAPVMTTLAGKSALEETHPLSLGLGGFPKSALGTSAAHHFARQADCVLAIGNHFAQQATTNQPWPKGVKLIHAHLDYTEIDRIYSADVGLVGDESLVIEDLIAALADRLPRDRESRKSEVLAEIGAARSAWMDAWRSRLTSDEVPLNPFRVTWDVSQELDRDNTVFTHDAGAVRGHTCHHYQSTVPGGFVGWGQQSEMGWSVGGAMGIKLAYPERDVVYALGDGSFGMTGLDLETAVRCQIPTLGLIYNNRSMGIVMDIQRSQFSDRFTMVELGGDYVGVAKALGAEAERVEHPAEIRPALRRALEATRGGRAAIVEFMTKQLEPQPRPDRAPGAC
jgi:acetolactate synthase-1/2/3 large subunit